MQALPTTRSTKQNMQISYFVQAASPKSSVDFIFPPSPSSLGMTIQPLEKSMFES